MNGCIYRTKDNECELWSVDKTKSFCDIENCKDKKPTNADRIRSMTDEELARILSEGCHGTIECPNCCGEYTETIKSCAGCWLEWLKQEAAEA